MANVFPFACGAQWDRHTYVFNSGADAVSAAMQHEEHNHSKIQKLVEIVGRLVERNGTSPEDVLELVGLGFYQLRDNPHG